MDLAYRLAELPLALRWHLWLKRRHRVPAGFSADEPAVPLYGADGFYTHSRPLTAEERARYRADRDTWQSAASLPELANLTADWLQGCNLYLPGYDAIAPDNETLPLTGRLAAYNRAGLMTTESQPGHGPTPGYDGWLWSQRAAVTGFCDEATAVRLGEALWERRNELTYFVWPPGSRIRGADFDVDATVRTDPADPATALTASVFGPPLPRREVWSIYRTELGRAAVEALCDAWQVVVVDREFAERDTIWDALDEALGINGS
jgi:hypothetical protein